MDYLSLVWIVRYWYGNIEGVQYYHEFLRFERWPDPYDPWLLVTRSKSLIVHDEDDDDDRSIRSWDFYCPLIMS